MPATRSRPAAAPGRRERRRQETRERIFRAALRLFADRGFHATTIEDITEAADVGKGTFFNYFPSKEHALAAFAEVQIAKLATLAAPAARSAPLEPLLRRTLRLLAEEPGRSPKLVRGMLAAVLSSDPVRSLMRRHLKRGRRLLAEFLAARQRRGEIRAGCDPAEIAWGIQQMFFGTMILWAIEPSFHLRDRLEATFPLFWQGFVTGGGQKKGSRGDAR